VRGGGLEPPHHCWRQDLNLVRLPISPSSLKVSGIGAIAVWKQVCRRFAATDAGSILSKRAIVLQAVAAVCVFLRGHFLL
jgi:hypothetical protein